MFKKIDEKFKVDINRKLLISSFIIYFGILIWAIIFKFMIYGMIRDAYKSMEEPVIRQFIYFFSVSSMYELNVLVINIVSNLLFFLPLGMYLPLLLKKYNLLRDIGISFLVSLSFELIQAFTRMGCPDIYDILINVIGSLIGSIIYYILRPKTSIRIINYIQLFVVITCLPILIYGIVSILLNIEILEPFFDFINHPYILI